MERTAKLFRNGGLRAVRIPREFKLDSDEVVLTQYGDGVLVRPAPIKRTMQELLAWLRAQKPLEPHERMPETEDLPLAPVTCFDDWPEDEPER